MQMFPQQFVGLQVSLRSRSRSYLKMLWGKVPETVLKGEGELLVCSVLAALHFIHETDFLWFWLMPGLLLPGGIADQLS